MILLTTPEGGGREPGVAIAAFGVGLVGAAVVDALRRFSHLQVHVLPLDWGGDQRFGEQLAAIEQAITSTSALRGTSTRFLWSAGRAGFGATPEEAAAELEVFRAVLRVAERHAHCLPGGRPSFHLVSSAGGLFEGQRHVGARSVPQPLRPYGRLKLEQEQLLLASALPARRIYRLSSVYGYLRPGRRLGLITTLLVRGVQQQVSFLTGRMSTLRDFVFVGDLAFHIARRLLADVGSPGDAVTTLSNGRPSSLFEVQQIVAATLGRKVMVSYSLDPANSADITFSQEGAPVGWNPSDLAAGVARVYRDALSSGALFSLSPPALF